MVAISLQGVLCFGGAGGSDFWILKLDSDGSVAWQKTYGGSNDDYAYAIQQTSDGGYILTGATASFGMDLWVLKLNSDGSVAWQKTYVGSGVDYAQSIQQTSDGGYIVAGGTVSFGARGLRSLDFKTQQRRICGMGKNIWRLIR